MMEEIEKILNIRYVKLTFTLCFVEDTILTDNKVSALRGGIGEMLLRANCVRNRECDSCDFESECIVQRMMYSKLNRRPAFMSAGDSVGYVIECEDYRTNYRECDILSFHLILFGRTSCYFSQYLNAIYALGQAGFGKNKSRFVISELRNTRNEPIISKSNVNMEKYQIETIGDYVHRRMKSISWKQKEYKLIFYTGLTQKYQGEFLQEFNLEAIVRAVERRIYIMNCFENIDSEEWYQKRETVVPTRKGQKVKQVRVDRYSNRKNQKITLKGICGEVSFENLDEQTAALLLAGEILHIGKNTSFGFGRYELK